jgi:transketolase
MDLAETQKKAKILRLRILKMAHQSRAGHVGCCLSMIDALTYLYFFELNVDPRNKDWKDRDYFILSKAHAAMGLYAVLAEKGFFDAALLNGYHAEDGTLPSHLDRSNTPGVEVSAGSLGHGLPLALGIAHGLKLRGKANRVFTLMGDGETQEGSVWEAAMLAPKLGLGNLIAIIDFNNLQGYGRPTELVHFEPVDKKWETFGWRTVTADGHDFEKMRKAFRFADECEGPCVVILHTVKGKGISFMEDELKWHYFIMTDDRLERALKELENA